MKDGTPQSPIPSMNPITDPDKPLAETTMVFAHNAYNSVAYGANWPNQNLSISEVLDMGINGVELDVYYDKGELRLCHLLCADYGLGSSLKMQDALTEVATWMKNNPDKVVFLKIEDHLDEQGKKLLREMTKEIFDANKIFTPENLTQDFDNTWPSLNSMSAAGKNLVLMPQSDMKDPSMFAGGWGGQFKQPYTSGNIAKARDLGFQIDRTNPTQLLEVGEDRAPLGTGAAIAEPLIRKAGMKHHSGGRMTKADVEELKKNGVNIISMDFLKEKDPRLGYKEIVSNAVENLQVNPYVFIPASIIAGVASAKLQNKTDEKKDFLSKTIQTAIDTAFSAPLSIEGKMIFRGTKEGVLAYNRYVEQITNNKNLSPSQRALALAHAVPPVIGGGLATGIKNTKPICRPSRSSK